VSPSRILVVRLGAIGDVVNALPAVVALRGGMPDVEIHWAVERAAAPLLEDHPALDRVRVFPRAEGPAAWGRFVQGLRSTGYRLAIDFQRTVKSGMLALLSGAPERLGFDRRRCKETSWIFCNRRIPPNPRPGLLLEQYLEFPRALGVRADRVEYRLRSGDAEKEAIEAIGLPRDRAVVVLHVGSTKPANRWSAPRFAALADALAEHLDAEVVLAGGRDERPRASRIARLARRPVRDLVGATKLRELMALLERADVVVSADSGPLHLAVALGRPVVGLYGAANVRRTGPHGALATVVRGTVFCSPCRRRTCPYMDCMRAIEPPSVLRAVAERLERPGSSPAPADRERAAIE
jgi:lipopolysaccharide heptosyltransferase I